MNQPLTLSIRKKGGGPNPETDDVFEVWAGTRLLGQYLTRKQLFEKLGVELDDLT